jgi:transposase-like protein
VTEEGARTRKERGDSKLTIVENVPGVSADSAPKEKASTTRARGARRPKLSPDEEREIARLYADTNTSTSEICARLGIGESSLYRIVQRQGIPLRGRNSGAKTAAARSATPAPTATSRRSSGAGRRAAASAQSPAVASGSAAPAARTPRATRGGTTRRGSVTVARTPAAAASAPQAAAGSKRFRVRYQGERVFEAQNMQDALRQAESLGATEITGVAREDR